jgi:hypothetical protein
LFASQQPVAAPTSVAPRELSEEHLSVSRVAESEESSKPASVRPRNAVEAFGMFRGMTLQEAVQVVRRRS